MSCLEWQVTPGRLALIRRLGAHPSPIRSVGPPLLASSFPIQAWGSAPASLNTCGLLCPRPRNPSHRPPRLSAPPVPETSAPDTPTFLRPRAASVPCQSHSIRYPAKTRTSVHGVSRETGDIVACLSRPRVTRRRLPFGAAPRRGTSVWSWTSCTDVLARWGDLSSCWGRMAVSAGLCQVVEKAD